MAETSKFHECEVLKKRDNVSIQKIQGSWYWVFWNEKNGNEAHGITHCPYCCKEL